ncbi:phenylalanine--tRNA ligase subunit beta [Alkalicoccus daliensis]|uniref:Phenylalanine--tRNA ligase beta subunit n=1 Tax=Alkalicoccus daliensis TaxID=745820 RepID=A0A1H0CFH8_9BACI|nr:phenylalanine--tRNA ligase subunit beta [Alkalicoccus daliensis]SDN56664.1 phenylalanyl-tRNA synthetase beta subunit [Alkalicoccus daliensis]
MLISYEWLKEYIDLSDVSPEELADKLTLHGVEVDAVTHLDAEISNLVVGEVISCEPHPDADKLKICEVNIGEEENVQIVCGAANVAQGQFVPVAKVGGRLPGGVKIKRAKLRGQVSEGMICSLQELGFEGKVVPKKYSEGIYAFPEEVIPGMDAVEVLGLRDTVLELDLTPNRSDCLSLLGVAYEAGAILDREVHVPEPKIVPAKEAAEDYVKVTVEAKDANPYYGATMIRDIHISESPLWLQTALMAAGVRPLNNVVDITNYVLLEYGQPLHAFDFDRFGSNEVVVRRAREEESMTTLDGEERTLSSSHLVITNGQAPTALAGVMGGATSEVEDDSVNILLEAAYFDPAVVRQAQRDLGIRSDSSIRFEKGVDPNRVVKAGERAASLIQQLAGGSVLSQPVEYDELNREEKELDITLDRINHSLGTSLSEEDTMNILERLKFDATVKNGTFSINVPTRRQDISIEPDIVEEVARLFGYDNIPVTLPNTPSTKGGLTAAQKQKRSVRRYLESCGLHEAVSYSLTTPQKEAAFEALSAPRVHVALPMSEERSSLRTTLLPHLLDALSHNRNRNLYNVSLYEIGSVFHTDADIVTEQPEEKTYLAGAFTGLWEEHAWQGEKKQVDFFVVKGILEGLLAELKADVAFEKAEQQGMHPGRTANVLVNGEVAGIIGQLHPVTAKEWSLPEVYVFELNLAGLLGKQEDVMRYQAIPRYPAIERDIALVVDKSVSAGTLERVIRENGGNLLADVRLFDLYEGEHVASDKKSVAFSLRYLDREKTLTDEDVAAVHEQVLEGLREETGAVLRA